MKEDFVGYEIAKKLKEKGFYYKCVATYDNDGMLGYNYIQPTNIRAIGFDDCLCSHNVENDNCIDAPTISQVLKWLREEKKIYVAIDFFLSNDNTEPWWTYTVRYIEDDSTENIFESCKRKSWVQAVIAGIEYVIDNLI